jgi:hypothetical protein
LTIKIWTIKSKLCESRVSLFPPTFICSVFLPFIFIHFDIAIYCVWYFISFSVVFYYSVFKVHRRTGFFAGQFLLLIADCPRRSVATLYIL